MGKIKIFNDPVYGFVRIPRDILFEIIEHPYFQRLRRIKQLGLTDLVYPGAHHSRFHHTLGAVHLMSEALDNLKLKGIEISDEETEAALLAILLHDIGHGPFSHALENKFITGGSHEQISLAFMQYFNNLHQGRLQLAIEIFKGSYHRPFLCQLVSGQLDVDRLDYLRRDSFYTGVSEGVIGSDRIIKMMNVHHDELVVDEKGIYSIEKFLIARNLMYWQVYLHKTVISAEMLLVKIIERAAGLYQNGFGFHLSKNMHFLLKQISIPHINEPEVLAAFAKTDDTDVFNACKEWCEHPDPLLANLCRMLVNRNLLRVELRNGPTDHDYLDKVKAACQTKLGLGPEELNYYVLSGEVSNTTYQNEKSAIKILDKKGRLTDFAVASEQYDLNVLTKEVQKHYICYPKSLIL
ncbi:HD domain-containing protein [bacterium]|nr:HD domain-containing protein [bacterium]